MDPDYSIIFFAFGNVLKHRTIPKEKMIVRSAPLLKFQAPHTVDGWILPDKSLDEGF
jgi:hypothetical protein